ncbi:MAG: VLRF1 family aeRF1-type release factor [Chloroherpetonaceae bacterium]|nr:VLRF1 family aeRF1-type release factor [Chloroherpetonaceae bacterium]MCS7212591.1 VLRF1 family aeRF1-type release factor [Chloroherpetonaceae bacterium]MDW8018623.1 VLRF1 family aeRF1-type release factor [Chloroherpetonaceae bacterium]MDW8467387.1 VLRF1 family aeRF1-type release factor [Chloroherpetonaceae bacterium]
MNFELENTLAALRQWGETAADNFLSIYADINPAKPENLGGAWKKRIKSSLKDLTAIREPQGKHDQPLYDKVLELIEAERPEARTLALFAYRDARGTLHYERLDLQIELPVINVANGHVEVRYGRPYLTPLWFAVDEYERVGILVLDEQRWRIFEVYLGEVREDRDIFASIDAERWAKLRHESELFSMSVQALRSGRRFERLSAKDRAAARLSDWLQSFYKNVKILLERFVDERRIERLVMLGEEWQVSHFESYLSPRLLSKLIAKRPLWQEAREASAQAIWKKVEPEIVAYERAKELQLLEQIKNQPGIWGVDPVLDALQLGRVRLWVLPWHLDQTVWYCPDDQYLAATKDIADRLCQQPIQVSIKDYAFEVASTYGTDIDFVCGEAETRLLKEMGGMAALLRW